MTEAKVPVDLGVPGVVEPYLLVAHTAAEAAVMTTEQRLEMVD
jgi:hypothetical protein